MQCYSCFDDSNYQYHGVNYDVKAEQEIYLKSYKDLGKPIIQCVSCGNRKKYIQKEDGRWKEVLIEKYTITLHINSFMTSGVECNNLDEIKDFIKEELFQAKYKGNDSITLTIKVI